MRRRHTLAVVLVIVAALTVGLTSPALGAVSHEGHSGQSPECEFPVTVTDATDTEVAVEEAPEEIVVLHAGSAQVVHDIGAWDRVTGAPVTPFTAYLENHDAPTDVTDEEGFPVRETIVNLSPDLVLADGLANPETIERLREDGLTVYMSPEPASVEGIKEKVERYGRLTGACEGAADRVDSMESRLADLPEPDGEGPLVYHALGGGWTTGANTFQADMIERAGGRNLASEAGIDGASTINAETVVDLDPDWIVYGDAAPEAPISEAVQQTTAFQRNRTLAVNANYIAQAGPRVVHPIETMAEAFASTEDAPESGNNTTTAEDGTGSVHGDADNETSSGNAGSDEPDDERNEDENVPLPGFGVAGAIVAVLLVSVRRRLA